MVDGQPDAHHHVRRRGAHRVVHDHAAVDLDLGRVGRRGGCLSEESSFLQRALELGEVDMGRDGAVRGARAIGRGHRRKSTAAELSGAAGRVAIPPGAVYCPGMPKTTLAVRADEKPWTAAEKKAVRTELEDDLVRLRKELDLSAKELQDLLRDGVDGAGNDQADVGSTSLERDAEMSLAANQRITARPLPDWTLPPATPASPSSATSQPKLGA